MMFTSTMFAVGSQASFVYPDSKTNVPTTRNGIVEKVTPKVVTLAIIDPNTQATIYKSFSYEKMQKMG